MAGLIDRMAQTDAVIKMATGAVVDGNIVWDSGTACKVFVLENEQTGFDEYGHVQYGKVFLTAPTTTQPVLPARLTVGGVTYDIASVKPYRNMRGKLLGYRLTVPANGGA